MRYQAALRPDLGGRTYSPPPSLASRNGGRVRSAVAVRFAPPSRILRAIDTHEREHFLARAVVFAKYAHHSAGDHPHTRSEEHTSELQSLMRISYAVFCLKKKQYTHRTQTSTQITKINKQQK